MTSQAGDYDHINKESQIKVSIPDIAKQLASMNYGVHRMLSAIVKERLCKDYHDELARGIQDLLNKGLS